VFYLGSSQAPRQGPQEQGSQGMREEQQPVTTLPEPTTTSEIDTSDWKTYRNEKYGFEVRYPKKVELFVFPDDPAAKALVEMIFGSPIYQPDAGAYVKPCRITFGLRDGYGLEGAETKEDTVLINGKEEPRTLYFAPDRAISNWGIGVIALDYRQNPRNPDFQYFQPHFTIIHSTFEQCLPLTNRILSTFRFLR